MYALSIIWEKIYYYICTDRVIEDIISLYRILERIVYINYFQLIFSFIINPPIIISKGNDQIITSSHCEARCHPSAMR